jgi:non-heme chloroperoxidase
VPVGTRRPGRPGGTQRRLVLHGDDDDQIVPIQSAGLKSVKLLRDATLKVYPGAPHGLTGAHELEFNDDLLDFIES